MKKTLCTGLLFCTASLLFARCALRGNNPQEKEPVMAYTATPAADNTRVQVALLLDTSNSMDGLIEQAKSRLWNIVNTLTTLKYNGQTPVIEISLYEYGNDGLAQKDNYIRQVTPMTTDLDLISEKLFALRTNGGQEYCGAVISEATGKLTWGKGQADMKLMYIAGNEPFNQGGVNYKEAVSGALAKNIYVNTIYCGSGLEGIEGFWKDGAERGQGKYFTIDSDVKVRFIETPYDKQISDCNERINSTYIAYGAVGRQKQMNQLQQDANAKQLSTANAVERSVSKSKKIYKNDSWDLVDRVKADSTAVSAMRTEELPAELKGKTKSEIKIIIAQKSQERDSTQKQMAVLAKKRQAYIDEEMKKTKNNDDIGEAIKTSIYTVAKVKGYTVEQ
ncbi:hypothetical protein HNQ91_003624 [Filimonas zeae]|uniref:von Willebrand factor type A domain-containing protein n=1 Tax=Filimonas zeae TaxID=1737353 RepID=A0A917J1Y9_9BACT|nr:hypothetical protein [Filimonas zeae]MDR6340559.1 hypothetical protein [Filimonas zeae]GGH73301.1 hypothetical protein GCM10011379_34660 [Filimonas zeae]